METFDLTSCLKPWAVRLLRPPRTLKKFLKDEDFNGEDIAEWLEYTPTNSPSEEYRRAHFESLLKKHQHRSVEDSLPDVFLHNFGQLVKLLGLDPVERKILLLLILLDECTVFAELFSTLDINSRAQYCSALAEMLEVSSADILNAVDLSRPLTGSGLVVWKTLKDSESFPIFHSAMGGRGIHLELTHREIGVCLLSESYKIESILNSMVREAPPAQLSYRDFSHLSEPLQFLRPYLRNACRARQHGVNVFLYGMPGTGKTELVRTLAREMKSKLLEVPFEDQEGGVIAPDKRLNALRLSQRFLSNQRAILVFDEAEDIFEGESVFSRSLAQKHKAWVNRMLEQNPVPTVWVSNGIPGLDPAFARRFDFIFELSAPPRSQRMRILKKICGKDISAPLLERFAESPRMVPAVVARAHAVAVKSCADAPEKRDAAFSHLVRNTLSAQGHDTAWMDAKSAILSSSYDPNVLNADADLKALLAGLRTTPTCRLCLYGPPGTGKTSFGQWIARELDKPIKLSRASDILHPHVGMSERRLSALFREASRDSEILMIDEVDSFLQDRRQARHSWEITLINEMLTQMESFDGIFIASTNLMNDLDQASLRRFDLKVRLDYLRPKQAVEMGLAWSQALGLARPSPDAAHDLRLWNNVTPGDFANAARQHPFKKFTNGDDFIRTVTHECQMKEDARNRGIGFNLG